MFYRRHVNVYNDFSNFIVKQKSATFLRYSDQFDTFMRRCCETIVRTTFTYSNWPDVEVTQPYVAAVLDFHRFVSFGELYSYVDNLHSFLNAEITGVKSLFEE